jgi:hypothetical protein
MRLDCTHLTAYDRPRDLTKIGMSTVRATELA